MDEVIRSLTGPQFIGLTAVVVGSVCVTAVALIGAVAPHWRRVRQTEVEAQLKRDLVAAGFTADEIERVVRATGTGRPDVRATARCHRG